MDTIKTFIENPLEKIPTIIESIKISKKYHLALHPKYTIYLNELNTIELPIFLELIKQLKIKFNKNKDNDNKNKTEINNIEYSCLPQTQEKRFLEILGIEHTIKKIKPTTQTTNNKEEKNIIVLNELNTQILLTNLGIDITKEYNTETINKHIDKILNELNTTLKNKKNNKQEQTTIEIINKHSKIELRDKGGTYIGCRMGRPEKAKMRKNCQNETKIHGIFKATNNNKSEIKGLSKKPNNKGIEENKVKAILREKNNIYVNKDGTCRFDMTQMGITHFKQIEIGTSIEKLKELGYKKDYQNKPITNENQLIEIFPQDVILPDNTQSGDELASDFIINVANFIDDELENIYNTERFYNFKTKEDTIGHLIIGLAPHTSAAITGRIIGYTKTQGCFANPIWHAAQRRNLDGDETGIMLLLDALINFSKDYLPQRRGSKMDIALVLTSILHLDQVDDEVFNIDITDNYPLELYKQNKKYTSPKEIKIKSLRTKLKTKNNNQKYSKLLFTHNTTNLNNTVLCSAYKTLPKMAQKLDKQLKLAKKIRAVDQDTTASLIIEKHFMKDIKGNLRKFSQQTFRCTNCNKKYSRPPLNAICTNCRSSSINFTVHEGSIRKYLDPSFEIAKNFKIDPYLKETLDLVKLRVESLFGKKEIDKKLKNH